MTTHGPSSHTAWLAAWLIALSPATAALSQTLEQRIAAIMERPEFAGSTFSVLIQRLKTGEPIYAFQPRRLMVPASTAKLVSCGGALAVLGKDFRWETPLVRTGPVRGGVLHGDLVLVSSGDPNLSQRIAEDGRLRFRNKDHTYAGFSSAEVVTGDPLVILRGMVKKVVGDGIRAIQGDIVVDDGLFSETTDSFVGSFSAICVNDNVVDITVYPGDEPGDAVEVEYRPDLPTVRVKVSATTAARGSNTNLWVETRKGAASFEILGTLPAGSAPMLRVGRLVNPAVAVAHYLGDLLEDAGVKVPGNRKQGRFGPGIYKAYPAVARHISPPFSEAMRVALKVSHNLHATMFPVVAGSVKGDRGDRVAGYKLIREYFRSAGLDVDSVILQSGSGGGRADRLSAEFLVGLLRHMATRKDFPEFYDALPVGGVDGTLAGRFRSPNLRGRIRAKTGTLVYRGSFNDRWIYLSKALAGYLDLRSPERPDEMFAFSIFIGNTVCAKRNKGADRLFRAQEEILRAVVESREEE